jgi:hypothetical protein
MGSNARHEATLFSLSESLMGLLMAFERWRFGSDDSAPFLMVRPTAPFSAQSSPRPSCPLDDFTNTLAFRQQGCSPTKRAIAFSNIG